MNKGLNDKEVLLSRKTFGSNTITKSKKRTIFLLIIESLNDPIIKILLIALGIKIFFFINSSDIYETIGIIVAIIVATVISSISEYASEKAFERLSKENDKIQVKVIRNSSLTLIPIEEIVTGDILMIQGGDKMPADAIIIDGNITLDESMLTGETKEKYKEVNDEVYRGTICLNGKAFLKVNKVGDNTFYGKIAKDINESSPVSPLKLRLNTLARQISKIGYIGSFLVMVSYLFNTIVIKNNFNLSLIINTIKTPSMVLPHILYSLTLAVTIIVVSVPEGLPMMVTLVLSSNMKRLLKNNVLVRKLVGIESSGSLNILFTDKTGTITEGKLKMIKGVTYSGKEYKSVNDLNKDLKKIVNISLICNNDSEFVNGEIIGGNSTDAAIRKFVKDEKVNNVKVLYRKEFNSKNKYSYVDTDYEDLTFYKGAYEMIIDKCIFYYEDNSNKKIIDKRKIMNLADSYTSLGFRVLAIATGDKDFHSMSFLSLLLIKDEVRSESKDAIRMVNEAGVQTVMITGDNVLTAKQIAKEVGIINNENDIVLTSNELNKMNDEEIKKIIPRLKVVARSMPEDKKRLVMLSEELDLVTGMTGDGINDAPALRKADVGFAMGSGSEVAKEVSDIIILDNNFNSIAKSILFGRTIFKNIRKFLVFQLTVNITTVFISIIGPFFGIISPITAVQMLWINMIMDTFAGAAYSFEPPLMEYMKEKPKRKDEKIMNSYMINEIIITGSYMSLLCMFFLKSNIIKNIYRFDNRYLMTAFFSLFIFLCIFNAFNARSYRLNIFANLRKNKVFLFIILLILIIQLLLIYKGGNIFRTIGLSIFELNFTLLLASTVIPFDFIRKKILKKLHKSVGV